MVKMGVVWFSKPRRNEMKRVFALVAVVGLCVGCSGGNSGKGAEPKTSSDNAQASSAEVVTTASGLKYQVLQAGTGEVAKAGQNVSVHYTGWLTNGQKFDSSVDRGQPFQFALGAGQVIRGWDEGVAGMKVGEKRKLTIPPQLGYGAGGAGNVIPPNATLVFDVELLGVR
jgi:FKBP-type peptidyl-prolyl cis-trans isomerase